MVHRSRGPEALAVVRVDRHGRSRLQSHAAQPASRLIGDAPPEPFKLVVSSP